MGNRTENSQAALRLEGGQLDIKERMREYRVRRWILPVEPVRFQLWANVESAFIHAESKWKNQKGR